MKILLFGGSGILGSELQKRIDVIAPKREEYDILKSRYGVLSNLLSSADIIINCAVIKDERYFKKIYWVNTVFPTYLSEYTDCSKDIKKFIHISTDYVFKGTNETGIHPYPNSLIMFPEFKLMPIYSFTKWLAENNVLLNSRNGKSLIIRTSFLSNDLIKKAPINKITSAEYVDQIADKIVTVINNLDKVNKIGILHIGSKTPISVYDLAKKRNENVIPFTLKQNFDFSLDVSSYYMRF